MTTLSAFHILKAFTNVICLFIFTFITFYMAISIEHMAMAYRRASIHTMGATIKLAKPTTATMDDDGIGIRACESHTTRLLGFLSAAGRSQSRSADANPSQLANICAAVDGVGYYYYWKQPTTR